MPPETPLPNAAEARTPTGEIKDPSTITMTSETPTPTTEPTSTEPATEPAKTEESKPEVKEPEGKPSLVNAKDTGAPEKYEAWTAPEGFEIPEATSTEINALFKELNLSQESGQRLIDFYAKQSLDAAEGPVKLWEQTQERWVNEVKADKEIGGKLNEVRTTIARAIDGLGDSALASEFRKAMDYTGAGNNPAFIKAFYRLAQRLTEGQHVSGNGPSTEGQQQPGTGRPSAAKSLFPNLA